MNMEIYDLSHGKCTIVLSCSIFKVTAQVLNLVLSLVRFLSLWLALLVCVCHNLMVVRDVDL